MNALTKVLVVLVLLMSLIFAGAQMVLHAKRDNFGKLYRDTQEALSQNKTELAKVAAALKDKEAQGAGFSCPSEAAQTLRTINQESAMKQDPIIRLRRRRGVVRTGRESCPEPWKTWVMAQWRSLGWPEAFWLGLLRRGLVASLALAAASLVVDDPPKAPSLNELALADTMIQNQLWP